MKTIGWWLLAFAMFYLFPMGVVIAIVGPGEISSALCVVWSFYISNQLFKKG